LHAAARRVWRGPAYEFPRDCIDVPWELDFTRARPVQEARGIDHCYSGWSGNAAIDWPSEPHRVTLASAAPLEHLLVYVPADREFFCVEPVSHPVNALNFPAAHEHAPRALDPGQELAARVTLRCEAV
jgi:aldose 1-epimerase